MLAPREIQENIVSDGFQTPVQFVSHCSFKRGLLDYFDGH